MINKVINCEPSEKIAKFGTDEDKYILKIYGYWAIAKVARFWIRIEIRIKIPD